MTVIVLRADARRLPLPDSSVDLVVTSPPYWALRSYGGYDGEIGSEPTPQEYLETLWECTAEWARVLKPEGSMWINLSDKFSTGSGGESNMAALGQRLGTGGAHKQDKAKVRSGPVPGMRPKSLLALPWRYAIGCVDRLGLILREDVVWAKPNSLPESVVDRCRRSHEYLFHLTRQPRYYSAVDEIRETYAESSQASYAKGGLRTSVGDATHPSKANGGRQRQDGDLDGWRGNPLGKLPGSVWTIPSEPLSLPDDLPDHFAAYPSELVRRVIAGWCPRGVCVACGQGRRPVAAQTNEAYAAERARVRANRARTAREAALGETFGGLGARTNTGGFTDISHGVVRPAYGLTGYACACPEPNAPTRPGVVADPFGGTGTSAHVSSALGRIGISVDRSADYARIAAYDWLRRARMAKVLGLDRPEKPRDEPTLFDWEVS